MRRGKGCFLDPAGTEGVCLMLESKINRCVASANTDEPMSKSTARSSCARKSSGARPFIGSGFVLPARNIWVKSKPLYHYLIELPDCGQSPVATLGRQASVLKTYRRWSGSATSAIIVPCAVATRSTDPIPGTGTTSAPPMIWTRRRGSTLLHRRWCRSFANYRYDKGCSAPHELF